MSTDCIYLVSDEGKTYILCLEKKTCSCNRFQVDGIPCVHAWRVLKENILLDEYCSHFYLAETIFKTYEAHVSSSEQSEWNLLEHTATEVVLPPKYKRHPRGQRSKRSHIAI